MCWTRREQRREESNIPFYRVTSLESEACDWSSLEEAVEVQLAYMSMWMWTHHVQNELIKNNIIIT